jgi:hypothetical protein
MDKAGLSQAAQGAFKMNYEQLVRGVTGLVRAASDARRADARCKACCCTPVSSHVAALHVDRPEGFSLTGAASWAATSLCAPGWRQRGWEP